LAGKRTGTAPAGRSPPLDAPSVPAPEGAPEIVIPSASRRWRELSRVCRQLRSLAPESLPGRLLLRHLWAGESPPDSPEPDGSCL